MAIDRTAAAELFDEGFQASVIELAAESSVAMQTLPRVAMSNKTERMPVLKSLPTATWLTAEGAAKTGTEFDWDKVTLTAEELAATVVMYDATLEDAKIDIVGSVRTRLAEAFAVALDAAVFFGTNAPTSFPAGGIFGAIAAGDKVTYATGQSWEDALGKVWDKGLDVTNWWNATSAKSKTLSPYNAAGDPVLGVSMSNIHGVPVSYPLGYDAATAYGIVGDRGACMLGVRNDIRFDISNEATVDGVNLFEQDATAIRAYARFGFALANPINVRTGARDYPLAAVTVA